MLSRVRVVFSTRVNIKISEFHDKNLGDLLQYHLSSFDNQSSIFPTCVHVQDESDSSLSSFELKRTLSAVSE